MCGAGILLRPQRSSGGGRGRSNTAGHNTRRQHYSLTWGRSRIANGHRCLSSQCRVPLEEPSLFPLTHIHVWRFEVAGLERGDDGHGTGAQRGWKEARSLIQAGAGDLGPSFSGRKVSERGPAEEGADPSASRITPLGRGKNRNGRVRKRERVIYIVTFSSSTLISSEE